MSRRQDINLPIQSTAGAVAVRNEKGQVYMQKVKVNRYISGKVPDYAQRYDSDSEDEEFIVPNRMKKVQDDDEDVDIKVDLSEAERVDPRLRRLQQSSYNRRRRIEEPEVLGESGSDAEERPGRYDVSDQSGSEDEEEDDKAIEKRRQILRQRALEKLEEEEILTKEEEKDSGESGESESEYEEYTESEEEEQPRLKPVFVRKTQRLTVTKQDPIEEKVKVTVKKKQEEKRMETLKLIESEILRDKTGKKVDEEAMAALPQLTDVNTDDEGEEADYEAWKLRELKRLKRDKEEREAIEREKLEIERLHNMTEEERRAELKLKPKVVINKASKGKYKFLQKYYHRGVFYLDKEEDVLKRDASLPTLEDHFDKAILPKVMQVKNFGRSGRTKYTHLVDQDTTSFESPWTTDSTQNLKFFATQAAGTRQVFEKPSTRKRHITDDGPSQS